MPVGVVFVHESAPDLTTPWVLFLPLSVSLICASIVVWNRKLIGYALFIAGLSVIPAVSRTFLLMSEYELRIYPTAKLVALGISVAVPFAASAFLYFVLSWKRRIGIAAMMLGLTCLTVVSGWMEILKAVAVVLAGAIMLWRARQEQCRGQ